MSNNDEWKHVELRAELRNLDPQLYYWQNSGIKIDTSKRLPEPSSDTFDWRMSAVIALLVFGTMLTFVGLWTVVTWITEWMLKAAQ